MADIYGRNPVREALQSGTELNRISVAKGAHHGAIDEIYALAKEKGVPVVVVERKKLDRQFPGKNHQGVAASVAAAEYVEVEDILDLARESGDVPLIVVCDEIEDPHNLGAILRNADAFGAHGVVIPKRRSASLTDGAIKAAAGAAQHVPVARVGNISQTLKALKKEGLWIAGADMDGDNIYEADLQGPLAVVIGSEGRGMGRLVKEHCDFVVSIPCGGHVGSLNASVAAGIILYEAARQRRSAAK